MKMSITTLLITILMAACSKSSSVATPIVTPPVTVTPDAPLVQYGTPFTQVPAPADAVIYQVNIRAFSASGKLQGVIDRLDSIKALGANVVYLMPVYPVGVLNSVNSPYCVKDYDNVGAEFGSLTDLRSLTDAAHSKGMAVIMDWVANHTARDHPWITSNRAWYSQDGSGNIISPPGTGWNDVAQLNFNNTDMRKAMIKAMKSWVYTANIDGYRCDAADFVPANFWKQAIDTLRNISSHQLLLFAEGTRNDHFASGFQMEYGMGFYYTLKNRIYGGSGPASSIDSVNAVEYQNATASSQIVRYTSNHDVDLTDGTPAELFGGTNGAIGTFIIAAYMKGVPMIYNGQEIGYPVRLNYFNNSTPINWSANAPVTDAYKQILALRKNSNAIKNGTFTSYSSTDACVFLKQAGAEKVLVLVNLRSSNVTYTVPAAIGGTWTNAFAGGAATLGATITLSPNQYMVLKN
jgi:glycosidase